MTDRTNSLFKHMIAAAVTVVLLGWIFYIHQQDPERFQIPYKRLIMLQPDGTKKVFMGKSAQSIHGTAYWVDKQGRQHTFTGTHWLDQVSSQTYHSFKPPAEAW